MAREVRLHRKQLQALRALRESFEVLANLPEPVYQGLFAGIMGLLPGTGRASTSLIRIGPDSGEDIYSSSPTTAPPTAMAPLATVVAAPTATEPAVTPTLTAVPATDTAVLATLTTAQPVQK